MAHRRRRSRWRARSPPNAPRGRRPTSAGGVGDGSGRPRPRAGRDARRARTSPHDHHREPDRPPRSVLRSGRARSHLRWPSWSRARPVLGDADVGPGVVTSSARDWRVGAATLGSWLVVAFAAGLIVVTLRTYRNPELRRQVGILWDVERSGPRTAHPLAPPCYSERSVPEFGPHRLLPLRRSRRSRPPTDTACVVVSAHSEGSVISAAMLLRLDDASGIALLTYGSPLRRLYCRYFPSYFGGDTLDQLHRGSVAVGANLPADRSDRRGRRRCGCRWCGCRHRSADPDAARPRRHGLPADRRTSRYPREAPVHAAALSLLTDRLAGRLTASATIRRRPAPPARCCR